MFSTISKNFFAIGIGILLLFIGIGIGLVLKESKPSSAIFSVDTSSPQKESIKEVIRINADAVKVTRVIDGDTIEIDGGERVRYIGIDTPETVDPRKPVQCFGVEASKKNKELVEGKEVRLEKDITERDKYGRLLRYIWVGDSLINLELVKQGFAYSYSYPPDVKYQNQFVKAQQEAREAKLGLWSDCPDDSKQVSSPSVAPVIGDFNCSIKGNISSSGEKIYHLSGCRSYPKTTIEQSRGERWFCTEAEAQSAGWRRALNCHD